jgi:hypothetical protein
MAATLQVTHRTIGVEVRRDTFVVMLDIARVWAGWSASADGSDAGPTGRRVSATMVRTERSL